MYQKFAVDSCWIKFNLSNWTTHNLNKAPYKETQQGLLRIFYQLVKNFEFDFVHSLKRDPKGPVLEKFSGIK